jgi:hypothetical protein
MKKLLLAGVAALFLATGTAHATDKLPDTITGDWCFSEDPDPNQRIYVRVPPNGCSGTDDLVNFGQDGAEGEVNCIFEEIKRTENNAFVVFSKCDFHSDIGTAGHMTLEIINGKLVATMLPEG